MRKILIYLLISMVILTGCNKAKQAESYSPPEVIRPAHASTFITKQDFYALLANRSSQVPQVKGRIVSGVLPHHLMAGRMIVDLMEALAKQQPSLVILIGPNHNNKGGKIISGLKDWQTPAGLVSVDQEIVTSLVAQGVVVQDEAVMAPEHSVGGLMPFIGHFLPDAKVVPIILHHDVSLQEIDQLLTALEPYLNKDTVLLASVDFSHYLTRSAAQLKDKETLQAMHKFDYSVLFQMDNDNLDSPASLSAAFRLAEQKGIKEFQVLDNTNSGILMKNEIMETTSYFTLVFTEE